MANYYNPYPYYNPYFVQNIPQYQPNNSQVVQNSAQSQPLTNQTNINWVQGESGAKSYPVAPNNTVQLMDSEQPIFYWKTVDQSGMPLQLRKFKYQEMTENSPVSEKSEKAYTDIPYATKDDIEQIRGEIEQIRSDMNKKPTKSTKKVEENDE